MRRALLLIPLWAWLLALVAAPLLIVLAIAFAEASAGVPPFVMQLNTSNFALLVEDDYYFSAMLSALRVAVITAALCLVIAYPMALAIARAAERWRLPLLALALLPFWTGFLLRLSAWIGLLRDEGLVNHLLQWLGLTDGAVPLLYTDLALQLGMVHAYLPFAILPLYATLARMDPALEEAAADLGARPATIFLTITLPLSAPGALAAFLLVFIPAAGEFVIPELLGPPEANLIGRVLWQEFFQNRDWPVASALAVALLLMLLPPILLFQRLESRP
jgi:putrescine transport system permease protein